MTLYHIGETVRTSQKMYINIFDIGGCFRRLNATHQIGCSSSMKGDIGVVHYLESEDDFNWVITLGPHDPYVVVMSSVTFNATNVKRLKESGKVSGILVTHVLNNDSITPMPPGGFSTDSSCPLDAYGMYNNKPEYRDCKAVTWNPVGNGLMYEDFGMPVFILQSESEVETTIRKCYEKFNRPINKTIARHYPLCSAELKSAMYAAKDSITCIRRTNHMTSLNPDTFCDPMGDENVFVTVKEINNTQLLPNSSVIMAAARIDSFSLFNDTTPSADNDITGMVALLAAAQALTTSGARDKIRESATAKDIMFVFFNGEAFDYIGSSRMVYEMEKNRFPHNVGKDGKEYLHPINVSHISHFIEMNQMGLGEGTVYVHTDPISRNITSISEEIDKMMVFLNGIGHEVNLTTSDVGKAFPLPPASVQRFLMKRSFASIVLTDHDKEFANRFYNSRFDVASEIKASYPDHLNESERYDYVTPQAVQLTKIATMMARLLYSVAMDDTAFQAEIEANETTVTHLLYCFLYDGKCDLFQTVVDEADAKRLSSTPYSFYVSVDQADNHVSGLTKRLLTYYLGDYVNVTKNGCKADDLDKIHTYKWIQGPRTGPDDKRQGVCYRTSAEFSEAKSPAFLDEMEDYDWLSGEYSTWTESVWNDFNVRLFLVPSKQFQMVTLGIGIAILLVSHCLVYFIMRQASRLFTDSTPASPSCPAN